MQSKTSLSCKIRKAIIYSLIILFPWYLILIVGFSIEKNEKVSPDEKFNVDFSASKKGSVVEHSKFKILQQKFTTPQQVTEACVTCHTKRHKEIMGSSHWTWSRKIKRKNGDTIMHGKKNAINNFCLSIESNSWKCTSCHIGYGWKDKKFDFENYKNIDCIVCHDTTGSYEKQPFGSGYPVTEKKAFVNKTYFPPNLSYVARHVGTPDIKNCGKCHFYGGGGDNVKHGDLSSDLYHADKNMDVHMDENGNNLTCVDCHKTENHQISGKLYSVSSEDKNRVNCEDCHKGNVHKNSTLNRHTNKIACQTCHIPTYAKGVPTNTTWDWSTSGKVDAQGKQIKKYDSLHNVIYKSGKGTYGWGTNLKPEYVWFNGTASHYVKGDIIDDTSKVLQLNTLNGSYKDKKSKIIPVKVHRGKQIFDTKNKTIIIPHIYGHSDTAFHHGLNWNLSAEAGMKVAGLPYSGHYGFVKTEVYWPLNHMVAPAKDALKCIDCHSKESRLKGINDLYIPGRDNSVTLDILGILMIMGALAGIVIHATIRIFKKKHIV